MNIDSAIESFFAYLHKTKSKHTSRITNSAIFYLGGEGDLSDAIEAVKSDLIEELSVGIPFPFECQTMFFNALTLTSENAQALGGKWSEVQEAQDLGWIPSWYACVALKDPRNRHSITVVDFCFRPKGGWNLTYSGGGAFRFFENGDTEFREYTYATSVSPDGEEHEGGNGFHVQASAFHLALIAHPANYIVKESPLLTPKEQRRIAKGKRFPGAKRPRYIIVDHDVLSSRMKPQGTHAAPAPHQRRGHWRRLAERCRYARARGVSKTWVRDCKVGETDFVANNRRYQVLMDFHDRYGTVTV